MSLETELISGMLRSEGGFRESLRKIIEEDLQVSVSEFCERTGLSMSTIYKIMQGHREPNLRTVRSIVMAVRKLEKHPAGNFIAIIASRPVLEKIEERFVKIGGKNIKVKEYPASTMEEAIISAVNAERDGALAVVCAPIIAPTVEKILSIPVAVVVPHNSVLRAIERAAEKIF
ncbi:MAG: helix-turn-helix domain-containing protein [Methanomassiliicoccales archaeon]